MTPEQEAAILEDVACGLSVVKAAESRGVHRMQFYRAMDVDAALRDKYARAKEVGLDAWADEVKEIADNVVPDAAEVAKADARCAEAVNTCIDDLSTPLQMAVYYRMLGTRVSPEQSALLFEQARAQLAHSIPLKGID